MKTTTKKSDILRAARKRLARHEYHFVCHAIASTRVGTNDQKCDLQIWIDRDLLNGEYTYSSWLETHHPDWSDRYDSLTVDERAEIKLPWVDWMIQYWEGQGQ